MFILCFGALMVIVESKNGRFWTNDWLVYVEATKDFFTGKTPYNKAYGLSSGFFKYPPFTLYLFKLTSFISFFSSQLIHVAIQLISLLISFMCIRRIQLIPAGFRNIGWLYLMFVLVAIQVVRELHMGNINLEILALFLLGLQWYERKSWGTAISWSLLILFKPILVIAVIPLLFFKEWGIIVRMIIVGLVAVLVSFIGQSIESSIDLWSGWIDAILFHGEYIINQTSFAYLTKVYFNITSEWWPSLLVLSIVLGTVYYFNKAFLEKPINSYLLFLALVPNLFKIDTQAFMFSLPLIMHLIILLNKRKSIFLNCVSIILLAGFALNSTDLWGKTLMNHLNYWGMLGIANIGLIAMYIFMLVTTHPEGNTKINE